MLDALGSLWFFLPAAVANMMPVIVARIMGRSAAPIDFGREWRGRPILGRNKTWRGLVVGTVSGGVFFILQRTMFDAGILRGLAVVDYAALPLWLGLVMGLGALFGDLLKSLVKRRIGIGPGRSWLVVDQVDYVLGGMLFTVWFVDLAWSQWLTILVVYFFLVIAVNHIAYYTGIRGEKW